MVQFFVFSSDTEDKIFRKDYETFEYIANIFVIRVSLGVLFFAYTYIFASPPIHTGVQSVYSPV